MASLEKRGQSYRIVFRYDGKKYSQSLNTSEQTAANADLARLEDSLRRIDLGTLEPPNACDDLLLYLLTGGQKSSKQTAEPVSTITLKNLFERYFEALPEGNLEPSTITGMRIHQRQLVKHFGAKFPIRTLTVTNL